MSLGIDTGTSQRNLDFGLARSQGYESCYVKLGGDNVTRYVAPHYIAQVDNARAAGMRVGHYWVPSDAQDPAGAANYFVDHLRGWTGSDFIVLDNESLDGKRHYSDQAAAVFIDTVRARLGIGGRQVKCYLGLSIERSNDWPALLGTGCDFIIAAYGYTPFTYDLVGKIPADRNGGHQYSSSANIGGVTIDVNSWRDWAFDYAGSSPAAPTAAPASPAASWSYWEPNGTGVAKRVQLALKARGRYDGRCDDQFGELTRKGVQITLNVSHRFDGPVDGVIEGGGCRGVQQYAHDFGDYPAELIDARLGINSWTNFALGLERP
ncbi:GH25 family lysozyme [Cryobacterium sp. SO1]|uniref:GH25 family lysozyme n=1 Tax=Cryobacterium sp. SO1 TaxID=1897061 RepID=UPI0010E39702|nr:GH25 family lysozyme [Cryobacterium sp. SO1]RZI35330.1 hypothetical protein BJQ95_02397 [Cryobacterium sp. SO1]